MLTTRKRGRGNELPESQAEGTAWTTLEHLPHSWASETPASTSRAALEPPDSCFLPQIPEQALCITYYSAHEHITYYVSTVEDDGEKGKFLCAHYSYFAVCLVESV